MEKEDGVFGLTSVQLFFVIILSIALVGYVIIVIMGALNDSSILSQTTENMLNESTGASGVSNVTGYVFSKSTLSSVSCSIKQVYLTNGVELTSGNWTTESYGPPGPSPH